MNSVVPANGWLTKINPVVKLVATMPWLCLVLFTRDFATPALLSAVAAMAILSGMRFRLRTIVMMTVILMVSGAWIAVAFALFVRPDLVANTPPIMAGWPGLRIGALWIGAATSMRLICLMMFGMLGTLGTTPDQLASALVHQCRLSYRYAYAAMLAARFVPRYTQDLGTLRDAQHARGIIDPRGPIGWLRRTRRSIIPLLAGGVRHAERLSLAMDARGFGAYRTRTDRNPARLSVRDLVFFCVVWGAIAGAIAASCHFGWLNLAGDLREFT